jgi:hypothetical protein
MERCREQRKDLHMVDLHMVFIDLEKAYDKVTRNVMWSLLTWRKPITK